MFVVPAEDGGRQDLLVGTKDGLLVIVHYEAHEVVFSRLGRTHFDGELVKMVSWEGYQGVGVGVILASRDPDLLYFVGVTPTDPYFDFQQIVSLPEDPGGIAFAGGVNGSDLELAVTFPGVDQMAILSQENGPWAIKQILAGGDSPVDLIGIDTDGDQVRELVAADNGALSRSLSLFHQDPTGDWLLQSHHSLEGNPRRLRAWDLDLDGRQELVVGCSDTARVIFLDVQNDEFAPLGSVPLVAVAMEFHLDRDESGETNLFVSNEERGLIEFYKGQDFPFTNIDSYYPGCLPKQMTLCDFDGDGRGDLAALGLVNQSLTVMFHQQSDDFWGHPALPLTSQPTSGVLGDFDGDGFDDLVVSGVNEKVLDFFVGTANGNLNQNSVVQEFPYLLHHLTSVQVDMDPAMELASIDPFTGSIRVLDYVAGSGFDEIGQMPLGLGGLGLLAADCDGDGLDDLVGIAPHQSTVKIYYGLVEGLFTEPVEVLFEGQVKGINVVDLTGDGLLDLVVTDGVSRVWTGLNLGNRNFETSSWVNAGNGALHIALADFDGDLDQDIVIGNDQDESLSFLENLGNGNLSRRIGSHFLPATPQGLECADLNLDGIMDVVVNLGVYGRVGLVLGLGNWQFGYPLTVSAGVNVTKLMVGDFNNDFLPDILALDGYLNLGLTLLNIERVLVAVHPSALTAQCGEMGLQVDVRLSPADSWSLDIGQGESWDRLARNGEPILGSCVFERERWLIDLSTEQLQAVGYRGTSLNALSLRLVVGYGADAEELLLPLAGICSVQQQDILTLSPAWVQAPFPNPFNPTIQAEYTLARAGQVQAIVLDARGRRVATLLDGVMGAGSHSLHWDGRDRNGTVSAGLYFLRISSEFGVLSQKIMLLK